MNSRSSRSLAGEAIDEPARADPSSVAELRRVQARQNANWTTAELYLDSGGATDRIGEATPPVAS